jgi:murein DD-endopeptidase MepM/ murein hydrolase activator NlpD
MFMRKTITLTSLLILSSCGGLFKSTSSEDKTAKNKEPQKEKVAPKKDLVFELRNETIAHGKAKKINLSLPQITDVHKIDHFKCFDGAMVSFEFNNNQLEAWASAPYLTKVKEFDCVLGVDGKDYPLIRYQVVDYPYKEERPKVKKRYTKLSKKNLERYQREVKRLNEVYEAALGTKRLTLVPFRAPMKSKKTSDYGSRRVFNDEKISWHKGVDYRARTGTPIPVANRGVVAFTGHLFFNGKTVIVDHGLGVMTMYCHLSKISVQEGEIIPQGQVLGLAGNTGRSTAAHLHWGVRVNGHWIDGLTVIGFH